MEWLKQLLDYGGLGILSLLLVWGLIHLWKRVQVLEDEKSALERLRTEDAEKRAQENNKNFRDLVEALRERERRVLSERPPSERLKTDYSITTRTKPTRG